MLWVQSIPKREGIYIPGFLFLLIVVQYGVGYTFTMVMKPGAKKKRVANLIAVRVSKLFYLFL